MTFARPSVLPELDQQRDAGPLFVSWPGPASFRGPLDYISFDRLSGRMALTQSEEFQTYRGGENPVSTAAPFNRPGLGPPSASPMSLRFLVDQPRKLFGKAIAAAAEDREALRHRGGCLAALRRTIPPELFEAAEPYGAASWRLYEAFAHTPELRELEDSNPGLAVALAHLDRLSKVPLAELWPRIRSLLLCPRRLAAGVLGFPDSRAAVRLMGRIEIGPDPLRGVFQLRELILDERTGRQLSHLPRLTQALLEAASDPELARRMTPTFLLELSENPEWDSSIFLPGILADTLRMSDLLNEQVSSFSSPRELFALHNRLALAVRDQEHGVCSRVQRITELPPPPIAGVPGIIEPLETGPMLDDEGDDMGHCVSSGFHGLSVVQGRTYLYRVLQPERATLMIERGGQRSRWMILELNGPDNQSVQTKTVQRIEEWLETGRMNVVGPVLEADAAQLPLFLEGNLLESACVGLDGRPFDA